MAFTIRNKSTLFQKNQVRNIRFENQDAEYYTMGWVAFCQFLGKTAMLGINIYNDRPLRLITSRLVNTDVDSFENFIEDTVLRNIDDPDKKSLQHILGQLSMQYYESNINHRFRGNHNDIGDWARDPKYRINQKMLDAVWLNTSKQEEAHLARKKHNLSRHKENTDSLVEYYLKNANYNLTQDSLYEELNRVHKDLEYYIGLYDPDPSLGVYEKPNPN